MTTVISFYTQDWEYANYANQIKESCIQFKLPYYIVEIESKNDYVKNCNIKPSFIYECLQKFKSPVLWIDADGSLLKHPTILQTEEIKNFDIAGNIPLTNSNRIHVGSIWFNYTDIVLKFVKEWSDYVKDKGIDDGAFNGLWSQYSQNIKFYNLPPEYHYIHKNIKNSIPSNTVICHRLSSSDLKWKYKNKVESR
jgi:hypothetical protein